MEDGIDIEREAIYREVWSDPVSTVSKRYGLSDNGLRKICKKLGVPLPEAGYWARLRAGQQIKRPKLPKHNGPSIVRAWPEAYARRFALDPDETRDRREIEDDEAREQSRIVPSDADVFRHKLIRALSKRLLEIDKQIEEDDRPRRPTETWEPRYPSVSFRIRCPGGVLDMGPGYAAVIVTPQTRYRALSIADAFFVAMEARGFKVRLTDTHTVIACKDINMQFRLSEMTEKTGSGIGHERWRPLGRLRITMRESLYAGKEIRARDEADVTLEEQLNMLAARLRIAVLGFDSREEDRREQARQHTEMMRRIENAAWHDRTAAEAAQREKLAVESLLAEADQSDACERRRRYLERVELLARDRGIDVSDTSRLGQWLAWARASCDALDPIFSRVSAH
ncbi:hypothetical protein LA345_15045 [Burkholderia vietnamiensis]|uniref:hypothetical protein n=1 Tax=Burkholderia vietnamiensis TaxID=60552 RepID=UPI00158843C9|nr:hypothetical protein [Burkholderia vietnamiensis]MCB4345222.1 hypothetical protein [Burkholderia vietnamiensis]